MITRVLLDMDGVLADFVRHICSPEELPKVRGTMNIPEALGITEDEMWDRTKQDPNWWFNIPAYSHTQEIIPTVLDAFANEWDNRTVEFWIVTQPHEDNPHCTPQKREWIKKNLVTDILISGLVPTGSKHLLSNDHTLLIDDDPRHIARFRAAGGYAILFPSYCNELHPYAEDPIPFLLHQLELLEEIE